MSTPTSAIDTRPQESDTLSTLRDGSLEPSPTVGAVTPTSRDRSTSALGRRSITRGAASSAGRGGRGAGSIPPSDSVPAVAA